MLAGIVISFNAVQVEKQLFLRVFSVGGSVTLSNLEHNRNSPAGIVLTHGPIVSDFTPAALNVPPVVERP